MKRDLARLWPAILSLLALGAAEAVGPSCPSASAQQTASANNQSWYSPITSSFKKVGEALDPKPKTTPPEDDAIALNSKSKPSPEFYVALGRWYEESGKLPDAEQQYQTALKMSHDHLAALLAYAHLKEQLGQRNEALWLYQRAAKTHAKEPSVYNNLGLFYARQGRLDDAAASMKTAIELAPKNPLYRNNIATVLVDQCRFREAFTALREVHGDAAAYYNMGYLLNKKGQTQAAMQSFSLALQADPSLVSAQRWIEYLERKTTHARLPGHPAAEGLRITTDRERNRLDVAGEPNGDAPWPNDVERSATSFPAGPDRDTSSILTDAAGPRRLPPLAAAHSEDGGPSLPGMSYDAGEQSAADPTAPLPPPSTNSAVRRLPQVK